jgi:hypothetical protein
MAGASARGWATLDLTESTKHPFEQIEVRTALRIIALVDPDEPVRTHIRDENPGYAQRQPEHRGHLCHRSPVPAELQDSLAFRRQNGEIARLKDGRRD